MTPTLAGMRIRIFADGADLDDIRKLAGDHRIAGFTTNPTLMRKSGVRDYAAFARELLAEITDRPVSFEVFADDFPTMAAQARTIAAWGANVYVKVPVTDTEGRSAAPLVEALSRDGVKLNVTALTTPRQVREIAEALHPATPAIVSVFAGRVADTGRDPVPLMQECAEPLRQRPKAELLWASPRELLNLFQAEAVGCHIITMTSDLLAKLSLVGKDLDAYSRETVQMFRRDAVAAGFDIRTDARVLAAAGPSLA